MEKTIICSYWVNKSCKFMEDSSKCKYAHGESEIKEIECIYGNNCYAFNCKFKHEDKSSIHDMVYDIPIVYKRKNKNKNKNAKNVNIENIFDESVNNNNINMINKKENIQFKDVKIVNIINKNKKINETVNIFNTNNDQLLSIVDEFYIKKYNNMVNSKNKYISMVVKNNYENIVYLNKIKNDKDLIIKNLNSENTILKNIIGELKMDNNKKADTISDMVEKQNNILNVNKIKNKENKIKKIYDKYINLYHIFNKYNNNYKLIDINEIRKYTKDNNIYKIRQRAVKVYNFCNKLKNGIAKDYLPLTKIY